MMNLLVIFAFRGRDAGEGVEGREYLIKLFFVLGFDRM